MSTRKAKRPAKAKRATKVKAAADTVLIRECVIYAQSVAAQRGGFRADPDGNSDHAAPLGSRFGDRAWQALLKIAATPSTTPEGLCAKVRIVPVIFEDNESGAFSNEECDLIVAIMGEVKKFLQPICDGSVILQPPPAAEGGAT